MTIVENPETQIAAEEPKPEPSKQAPPSSRRWYMAALVALTTLLVSGGFSIQQRIQESTVLGNETQRLAVLSVSVGRPQTGPDSDELELPGNVQAYTESPIYSRTNGYVQRWYTDIGAVVPQGALLADIETPEVDQQLLQARASREQIAAALDLARSSAERWRNLRETDSVSQQELDQKISENAQAEANLAAADANVRRLEQLESFKHIYAPFAGVITRRNVDIGALVNAGNGGSGQELFRLAQIDPLRVYVSVPETDSPAVHPGMAVWLEVAEFPGVRFKGTVMRSSNSIDTTTRTLLTEVQVPNKNGKLLPGAYAQVHFQVRAAKDRLSVPSNVMLFRAEGPRIAVVGPDGHIQLRTIMIGRDFGTKLEILQGIHRDDRIVLNPPDSLEDGQPVRAVEDQPSGKQS